MTGPNPQPSVPGGGDVPTPNLSGGGHGSLFDPEYDGIHASENPPPRWWKWIFIGTIAFSFLYFGFHHFGAEGRGIEDQYALRSAEIAQMQFAEIGELRPDRATLVRFVHEPKWLVIGKSVYKANCAACHGPDGGGIVGPNLTDDYYKNVTVIEDMLRVINLGAGAGAMPPWQGRLTENERIMITSYVASLRGTTPAGGGRAPEGREIAPWPTLEEVQAESEAATAETEAAGADAEGTENSAPGE